MTLWLVRHAPPLIEAGTCYGQLDIAADAQASQDSAAELLKNLPNRITIVTSTLQRCELLAHNLCGLQRDLIVKSDPRLKEMHFGDWEGRPWADIDPSEMKAWTDDFVNYRAGTTGESVTQFMSRVACAFDELDPLADTLWVTHAGVIRAASLLARGIRRPSAAAQWPLDAPAYGQWCKLPVTSRTRT